MKKLFIAGALMMSAQAFCFPHLMEYESPKQIFWNNVHNQQFMMFENDINSVKMDYVETDLLKGFLGTCPVTKASVVVTRYEDKVYVYMKENGKERECANTLQFIDDGILAYFDGGYVVIFDVEDTIYFSWAEYVN